MDPGALADRRPDRCADARGHCLGLALTALRAGRAARGRAAGRLASAACAALALTAARAAGPTAAAPALEAIPAYAWQLPRGFPEPAVPADNPMSAAKVALGQRLFFEPRLSVTGRYSCASCHDPARSFSDGRPVAVGATGEALPHNAMALVNVAYNVSFGWMKPQVGSLEAQMLEPLRNRHPIELGLAGREAQLCEQLAADRSYAEAFAAAFPPADAAATGAAPDTRGAVTFGRIVKAIAAFERTLISGRSPFDRYVFEGDHTALADEAKRGMALFFSSRVGCAGCHSGFNFSGNWRDAAGATGAPSFAGNGTTARAVRVPTLRNVALTAPYMHDGRFATLAEVLAHYSGLAARGSQGGRPLDRRLPHQPLTPSERAELIAFLESLTDESFVARYTPAATHAAIAPEGRSR